MKLFSKILFLLSLTVLFNNTAGAQGIIIPAGHYLVLKGSANIGTHKKFVNNGNFTAEDGSRVMFSGSGAQSIEGSSASTFYDILVKSGSTTTVSTSGTQLKATLKSNGTFNANSNVTLLSTATRTALVDGSGSGSVTGNLTMQRYMGVGNGYKYLSSPFTSATVNEFADDVDLAADFPTFYYYDENEDASGWKVYVTGTDPLDPVKGYAANFGLTATPKTIDATGVVSNGSQSPGTIYNHHKTYTLGFNLVGNPYPSPIDWEAPSGWTRTNIDDAIYFFNTSEFEYTGHYSSYINGVSSDDIANNIIPAMQGFFIHVSDGSYPVSATFSMNNSVRVNDLNPVFHKITGPDEPLIRMRAQNVQDTSMSDAAVIYFDEKASKSFDKSYDALKLMNTDERVPNLYVISPEKQNMSISAMPTPVDSLDIVPLGLEVGKDGYISLHAITVSNMPAGLYAYLADKELKTMEDIQSGLVNKLYFTKGSYRDRFSIVFSKKALLPQTVISEGLNAYSNGKSLVVYLNLTTGSEGELVIKNIVGQSIIQTTLTGYGYHDTQLPISSGIYIVSFYAKDGNVYTKKMHLGKEQ